MNLELEFNRPARSFLRFMRSYITNLKSESQNSKCQMQYGDLAYNISVNSEFCYRPVELGFFRAKIGKYNFIAGNGCNKCVER